MSDRNTWASGARGTCLGTTDGGATWTASTVPGAEALDFRDLQVAALELQSLDLQGTQMLVLSRCSMADGVPSPGERVFGRRRGHRSRPDPRRPLCERSPTPLSRR